MLKKWLSVAFLALALAWAAPGPASADEGGEGGEGGEGADPGELARDGIERLMRALEAFIDMIPQYEMPEMNEEGDIIIRRKREPETPPEEHPEFDETRT